MSGITDPAQKYFKDGHWTFDGTVWRPQNQLIAYRNVVRLSAVNADAAAGTVFLDCAVVAAGTVHAITNINSVDNTSALTQLRLYVKSGGGYYYLRQALAPPAGAYTTWDGEIVIKTGENIGAQFIGVVLHDVLVITVNGYEFLIAE